MQFIEASMCNKKHRNGVFETLQGQKMPLKFYKVQFGHFIFVTHFHRKTYSQFTVHMHWIKELKRSFFIAFWNGFFHAWCYVNAERVLCEHVLSSEWASEWFKWREIKKAKQKSGEKINTNWNSTDVSNSCLVSLPISICTPHKRGFYIVNPIIEKQMNTHLYVCVTVSQWVAAKITTTKKRKK